MPIIKEADIVVIGAGLSGLTLAHNLHKKGADFIVLERNPTVGGVIQTVQKNGFTFETGPNTGVLGNDSVMDLFDELSGLCQVEAAGNSVNKRYILKNGRWEAMPAGLISGITTPLFSVKDKFRILGEPFRRPGKNPNETLEQLVIRRMGHSFLTYAIDPFILGVYAGNPSYLVPKYALPKLYNLEQNYGSFIGGHIKMAREKKRLGIKTRATRKIFSVEGGLAKLIEALYSSAGKEHFFTGVSNIRVKPLDEGYEVTGVNGEEMVIRAKKVISTAGAHELPEMMPFLGEEALKSISNLIYARVVQVSLGFKNWNGMKLDGFGGLIPFKEDRDVLGVLFPSAFLKERAPEGGALLSVFIGGIRKDHLFDLSDHEIKHLVKNEISDLMGLKEFNPDVFNISRYQHAIPQYGADCEARFDTINKMQEKYKGLYIAGNLRNGIGMADRIKQGYDLAASIIS